MWEEAWVASGLIVASTIVVWVFGKLIHKKERRSALHDPTASKSGHHWKVEDAFDRGFYCSLCENGLTSGYRCDYCNLMVDEACCMLSASSSIPCKVNSVNAVEERLKHHWVYGNLLSDEFCEYCGELCGGNVGLTDFRCSWCGRSVHADCRNRLQLECDCGLLKQIIIPPNCVTIRKSGSRGQKQMVIDTVQVPTHCADWCPIVVVVNPKSGSGAGTIVMRQFRSTLHPVQVVDVTKSNMRATLRWLDENTHIKARVLIAGGDGTISFVLNDIDTLVNRPAVAVLPLGTGNDLSRVLRWGKESDGHVNPAEILQDIQDAEERLLDRWSISIDHQRKLGVRRPSRQLVMTNYISIGVDACVTFGMQSTREQLPRALSSRLLNKLLFFTFGTKDVFERACRGLHKKIELYLDDKKVVLPEIEGLVILNIPSWGAGVEPWNMVDHDLPQEMADGTFEVFAVRSSFHIAQLQVGLSSPIRIGQGKKATIKVIKGPLPMQCDGEAWQQHPSTVSVSHRGTSLVLSKKPEAPKKGYF